MININIVCMFPTEDDSSFQLSLTYVYPKMFFSNDTAVLSLKILTFFNLFKVMAFKSICLYGCPLPQGKVLNVSHNWV